MKKALIIIFLLVGLSALGAGISLSLAKTEELPIPEATVQEIKGTAEIKKKDSLSWKKLSVGEKLSAGDHIKTGADSLAVINFFDNSISRLGADSEISFNELFINPDNYGQTKVGIKMEIGKIWSQIIQLADRESSYEIESSNTVATVRGTIFDYEVDAAGKEKIYTEESYISLVTIQNDVTGNERKILGEINLLEGFSAETEKASGTEGDIILNTKMTSDDIRDNEWFRENLKRDDLDREFIEKKWEEKYREQAGVLPGSPLFGLKQAGEKLKIILAGDELDKQALEESFLRRRLSETLVLTAEGKTDLAIENLNKLEGQLDARFANNQEGGNLKAKIRFDLLSQPNSELMAEDSPELIKKLDEFELKNAHDQGDLEFIRAKQLERRIKRARELKQKGEAELFEKKINIIDSELQNSKQFNPEYLPRLQIKRELLDDVVIPQEEKAGELMSEQNPPAPLIQNNPLEPKPLISEPINNPIINPPLNNLAPEPQPTNIPLVPEPIVEKKIQAIKVVAPKYNIIANGTMQFRAMAVFTDGTTKDVTSMAQWNLEGDIGSISSQGLLSSDVDGGKGIVSAVYSENGNTWTGRSPEVTALEIMAPLN
jgi:hypothetical protein